ncbi:MAG TPA: formylglycine-generating enzyme family protein, partial [Aggregatilineales bacterium]|nr:formylglycine-generating enzyme family protein [Aggregatilineales bacterium]
MTYHQRWLISLLILVMGMLVACGEEQPATSEEESVNTIATHIANGGRVTRNQDWIWQEQEFDGVVMVLVPPGCFMMGSTEHSSQQPVHEQCFDTSFWIDKYEVTQYEFDQFNGKKAELNFFSGGARPVEIITWFEARDYCALRGGRLPTEREWE